MSPSGLKFTLKGLDISVEPRAALPLVALPWADMWLAFQADKVRNFKTCVSGLSADRDTQRSTNARRGNFADRHSTIRSSPAKLLSRLDF